MALNRASILTELTDTTRAALAGIDTVTGMLPTDARYPDLSTLVARGYAEHTPTGTRATPFGRAAGAVLRTATRDAQHAARPATARRCAPTAGLLIP